MDSLESIWREWIELHDTLSCDPRFRDEIAKLFISVPAADAPSILYVGKATSKDWLGGDPFDGRNPETIRDRISNRRNCTEEFIREVSSYNSAFWHLAKKLNWEVSKRWSSNNGDEDLGHVVWTNLFKIGTRTSNPRGPLREKQKELAIRTLRAEIQSYNVKLIYFVSGDYADDVVGGAIGDSEHAQWDAKMEQFWLRESKHGAPGVLWTYHPQGKSADQISTWVSKALEVLPA